MAIQMRCSKCCYPLEEGQTRCPMCGAVNTSNGNEQQQKKITHCSRCQRPLKEGQTHCPTCGAICQTAEQSKN